MHVLIIGQRVLKQLRKDKRFFALSVLAPLIIIYLVKILLDSIFPLPRELGVKARFAIPVAAFIVHFLSFLLCAILLVQERTSGTLERMFISGFKKIEIIGGYTIGYFSLATLQAAAALTEALLLFSLDYDFEVILMLFLVIWLLAVTSVMLGIFVSTFARHEGHVFPFIPLIILPSLFFSGVLINIESMPGWAKILGALFPLRYANNIVQEIIKPNYALSEVWLNYAVLLGYALILLVIASRTLREIE